MQTEIKRKPLQYLKPYRLQIFLAALLMLVEVGLNIWQPRLMASMIDDGVLRSRMDVILRSGGLMLAVAILGGISWTVSMIFIVVIGGKGTVSGPIVGAVIYVFLQEYLAHYPGWSNIILGVITILVILFLPDGMMGTLQKKLRFEIFSAKRVSFLRRR